MSCGPSPGGRARCRLITVASLLHPTWQQLYLFNLNWNIRRILQIMYYYVSHLPLLLKVYVYTIVLHLKVELINFSNLVDKN